MSTLTVTASPPSYNDPFHECLSPPSTVYACHSLSPPRAEGKGSEPRSSNTNTNTNTNTKTNTKTKTKTNTKTNNGHQSRSDKDDLDATAETSGDRDRDSVSDGDGEEDQSQALVSIEEEEDDDDDGIDTTPNSSIQRTSRKRHSVRFSTAEFRYYPITVGDNPSVTSGLPLSIGWDHWKEATRIVPVHEQDKDKTEAEAEVVDHRTGGGNEEDARDVEEQDTRDRREAARIPLGPKARYPHPTGGNCRRAILPKSVYAACFRCPPPHPSVPRRRDSTERAYLLMRTGHSRAELLEALHETTLSRNRRQRTARQQSILPGPVLVVLDWIREVVESCPRPCPSGGGGGRWCGAPAFPSTAIEEGEQRRRRRRRRRTRGDPSGSDHGYEDEEDRDGCGKDRLGDCRQLG
eukprot:jgi/Psemu1/474/gm1.474_g